MNRRSSLVILGAVALGAVACGDSPTSVRFEIPLAPDQVAGSGLIQTLELSSTRVARGSVIEIRSEVRNESSRDIPVAVRICGLDVRGVDVELPPETAFCGGYSMQTTLASGENVREVYPQVVRSGPGRYRLEVRHLLHPEHWAGIDIRVD
jgi:hypothetical protein